MAKTQTKTAAPPTQPTQKPETTLQQQPQQTQQPQQQKQEFSEEEIKRLAPISMLPPSSRISYMPPIQEKKTATKAVRKKPTD